MLASGSPVSYGADALQTPMSAGQPLPSAEEDKVVAATSKRGDGCGAVVWMPPVLPELPDTSTRRVTRRAMAWPQAKSWKKARAARA